MADFDDHLKPEVQIDVSQSGRFGLGVFNSHGIAL
jgi:hypothetical protein